MSRQRAHEICDVPRTPQIARAARAELFPLDDNLFDFVRCCQAADTYMREDRPLLHRVLPLWELKQQGIGVIFMSNEDPIRRHA